MSASVKRISGFAFFAGRGFSIDLEDRPLAVRVLPKEGDVLFAEGEGPDRLDRVCIPGRSVIRFEADDSADGAEVRVWFRAVDGRDWHLVGASANREDARFWVTRVNEIYGKRDDSAGVGVTAHTQTPRLGIVIHDIVDTRENIVLAGDYVHSASLNPPRVRPATFVYPGPSFQNTGLPAWQEYYVKGCMERIVGKSGCKGPFSISIGNSPLHEYPWISDRVKYPSKNSKVRITQPLEIMFDREQRRDKIGVNKFAVVRNFALVYVRGHAAECALGLKAQESAASSFEEWISRFGEVTFHGDKLDVCTPTDQSAHYTLKDAVFQNRIEFWHHHARGSGAELSHWLEGNYRLGVIACDIGVAYQVVYDIRRADNPVANMVDFALVPYQEPVWAGFCYRVDDSEWASVCSEALLDCSKAREGLIAESLADYREEAGKIGVEVKL